MRKLVYLVCIFMCSQLVAQDEDCFSLADFVQEIELENPGISIDVIEGWNMVGYTCYNPMNVIEAFSPIGSEVIIVKNSVGDAYLPEWSFNGIGDLLPGYGYQLKSGINYPSFQFCESTISFPQTYGCTDCAAQILIF